MNIESKPGIEAKSVREQQTPPVSLRTFWVFVALGSMVVLGLILPFFASVDGDDASRHLHWIRAFGEVLRSGVLVPQWLPDGFQGFGSPVFYFYPPLPYYISSLTAAIFGIADTPTLFNVTGLFVTLASVGTCYYLLRTIKASQCNSMVGSLFYAFAPYRLFELYTKSSFSQHVAFIFIPLIATGLLACLMNKERPYIPNSLLSISWALLLLSSLPLSIALALVIICLSLFLAKDLTSRTIIKVGLSLSLGTLLTLFHYLPALSYQRFIHPSRFLTLSAGNWVEGVLHGQYLRFDLHAMLLFGTHIALVVMWLWWRRKDETRNILFDTAGKIALLFLALEFPFLSNPLWRWIPPLTFIQFHLRFAIVTVLLIVILYGHPTMKTGRKFARNAIGLWSMAGIFFSIFILLDVQVHPHGINPSMDTPEYIPTNRIDPNTAIERIFLPHEHDPYVQTEHPLKLNENLHMAAMSPVQRSFDIVLYEKQSITLHQFAWPLWQTYLNGRALQTTEDSIGRVVLNLPAGINHVTLRLESTSIETTGYWISALSLVLLIGIKFIRGRRVTESKQLPFGKGLTTRLPDIRE